MRLSDSVDVDSVNGNPVDGEVDSTAVGTVVGEEDGCAVRGTQYSEDI